MEKINFSKKISQNWKTLAALMLAFVILGLVAGCTEQKGQPPAQNPDTTSQKTTAEVGAENDTSMQNDTMESGTTADANIESENTPPAMPGKPKGEMMGADTKTRTKTGDEQIKETIELVVANGMHEKEVTYSRPNGTETIDIEITTQDDIVTAVSLKGEAANSISAQKMHDVNEALPNLVVGKKITEIKLEKNIAGSSLTSGAFRQYLDELVSGKE